MGVWIETTKAQVEITKQIVTPYVGVWIETYEVIDDMPETFTVTPYVGVWIET